MFSLTEKVYNVLAMLARQRLLTRRNAHSWSPATPKISKPAVAVDHWLFDWYDPPRQPAASTTS